MLAVIFDMDGVMVDSELHWRCVEERFLKGLVPQWNDQHQQSILGMSAYDVYDRLCSEFGLKKSREEYLAYYFGLAQEIYGERSSLIDGCREAIEALSRENLILAVSSSSPKAWIEIVIRRFDLAAYFTELVSSDDVAGRGKPAPDIYLECVARLGLAAEDCLAIEDTQKGVQSAKAAGCRCLGFRNGFNDQQDLSAADVVVEGFAEVRPELLRGL